MQVSYVNKVNLKCPHCFTYAVEDLTTKRVDPENLPKYSSMLYKCEQCQQRFEVEVSLQPVVNVVALLRSTRVGVDQAK